MLFKSSTKTLKKKSLKNTQKKKSGTAKRSKNKSRKGGAKTKKTPSPSPESSGEDTDNYKIPEDLLPEEYTKELKEEDEKYVREVLDNFYENDEDIKKLKGMKTDTKAQRLKKKKFLVNEKKEKSLIPVLPKAVEDTIFKEINERQDKLDNYAAKKEIRDKEFEKIINKLEYERMNADDYDYGNYGDKINELQQLWKPEEHYEFNAIETAIFGEDPFLRFKEAKEHRIRYVEEYIRDSWNKGWRKAVKEKEKNPDSGRKLTDILIEDWLVPRCVDVYYGATYDQGYGDYETSEETDMIDEWNDAWIKANEDEYQNSDEFKKDEKKKEEEEYQKYIKNAEEKRIKEIAAAEDKRKREIAAAEEQKNIRQKSKEALRKRSRMKKAAEEALRTKTLTEKRKAETTETLPEPAQKVRATMPPAAGDGPTTSTETISYTEAHKLANANEHITLGRSKTNKYRPYMLDSKKRVFTWIVGEPSGLYKSANTGLYYYIRLDGQSVYVSYIKDDGEIVFYNNIAREEAANAVNSDKSGKFEIRTHNTPDGNFDYLINKENDSVAKIFD